ncbi:hypothetical protein ACSQ6I_17625 [Anabaena sp. WFMT]|uniref:hypothetical protein n=1 Tax=Anabaena sp. WFMT TaxID=3449730 RepID=UPI003F27F576
MPYTTLRYRLVFDTLWLTPRQDKELGVTLAWNLALNLDPAPYGYATQAIG